MTNSEFVDDKKIKETPNVEIVSGDDLIDQIKKIIVILLKSHYIFFYGKV